MAKFINTFINLLKWPIAIVAILLLIPVIQQLWQVLHYFYIHVDQYLMLIYGIVGYLLLWWFWFRRSTMNQWFSTLEHELTHALFAVLTLNRVTSISATGHAGGVTHFQGYGNWLIVIAPYFIPTLSLLILLILVVSKNSYHPTLFVIMGISLAYHFQSTWQETHVAQTDLQQSNWLFVWLFLPTANIIMYLFVLTALPNDALTISDSIQAIWENAQRWLNYIR